MEKTDLEELCQIRDLVNLLSCYSVPSLEFQEIEGRLTKLISKLKGDMNESRKI
jgi:hypothetical protein